MWKLLDFEVGLEESSINGPMVSQDNGIKMEALEAMDESTDLDPKVYPQELS